MLFFYYCGYSAIRNFILRLQHKPVTTFLYFHDIPRKELGHFKSNLNYLKQNTNVVSLDDFMSGKLSSEKINVVITFDDGFKSWITNAIPILQELVLPATFFISSGFVGLSKNDEAKFIKTNLQLKLSHQTTGGLTHDDLKRIVDQGFTIGGHTSNHCNLSTIIDKVKLESEIAQDKQFLEQLIDTKIYYFSYPFGFYHNPYINIVEVLQKAGYKGAVATTSGFNDRNTNPFFLHRESMLAAMHTLVFKARVYGNYNAVQYLKNIIPRHQH